MYAPTHHMYDFLCSIEKMKIQQKVNIVWQNNKKELISKGYKNIISSKTQNHMIVINVAPHLLIETPVPNFEVTGRSMIKIVICRPRQLA